MAASMARIMTLRCQLAIIEDAQRWGEETGAAHIFTRAGTRLRLAMPCRFSISGHHEYRHATIMPRTCRIVMLQQLAADY